MIFTIIAKLIMAVPTQVEADSVEEALSQISLNTLDTSQAFVLGLAPVDDWSVRTEVEQTSIVKLSATLKGLLDEYMAAGGDVTNEVVVDALDALRDSEQALMFLQETQKVMNERERNSSYPA